jgi:hypothetical protein
LYSRACVAGIIYNGSKLAAQKNTETIRRASRSARNRREPAQQSFFVISGARPDGELESDSGWGRMGGGGWRGDDSESKKGGGGGQGWYKRREVATAASSGDGLMRTTMRLGFLVVMVERRR